MLDPLPPDINPEYLAFSFAAKKDAVGAHIRARWPWEKMIRYAATI